MQGIELCRGFYEAYGAPMLHAQFPQYEEIIAVGLVGAGSECFGYDDEISRDHDFEPAFCLFLPDEEVIDRRTAFLLERAYAKLPKEYGGVPRLRVSPVGGSRHGVLRMEDFFREKIGHSGKITDLMDWFSVPEQGLAEATNGEVFRDDVGLFTSIRNALRYFPPDVRKKKLAGRLLLMAQSGQYNYARCLAHGESAAAQLAVTEFVRHTLAVIFLLNERYLPYYKWQFRALRELPCLSELAQPLEFLLTTGNEEPLAEQKTTIVEEIAFRIISALQEQNLTAAVCGDLEKHAYSVNDQITDSNLRNAHILFAVE
ncbi:MAG: DUF4037 domain-containing protein [Firmicutes bacterium]|nr:DUF4037 domain-containing protein [Bacillota bacterium]